jgi:hypothetical protein
VIERQTRSGVDRAIEPVLTDASAEPLSLRNPLQGRLVTQIVCLARAARGANEAA